MCASGPRRLVHSNDCEEAAKAADWGWTRSCFRCRRQLTTGEILAHFAEIYGASVSKRDVSKITDQVLESRRLRAAAPSACPRFAAAAPHRCIGAEVTR